MISPGSSISYIIPACLANVRLLGISMGAMFKELAYAPTLVFQLELAIIEAGNNIVLHAYQKKDGNFFHMEFLVQPHHIECIFTDQGIHEDFLQKPHTLSPCPELPSLPENHRGVELICNIMDEVHFVQKGSSNILTLRKYLPDQQQSK